MHGSRSTWLCAIVVIATSYAGTVYVTSNLGIFIGELHS